MALADDLLLQAEHLAGLDLTRPKQASLRRAISTSYYALFHLLLSACIRQVSPVSPRLLGPRIARAVAHAEMRDVCLPISKNNPGSTLLELVPYGFSHELQNVARAFVNLQEARHRADYDLASAFTRVDTIRLIRRTQGAFADWKVIQNSEEAAVFLCALLFARRWSK